MEARKYQTHATCNPEYRNFLIESARYAFRSGGNARYFSNTVDVLHHALRESPAEGLILEFGVYYGSSLFAIAKATQREVHGFDSFEGLPESWFVGAESMSATMEPAGAYTTQGEMPDAPDRLPVVPKQSPGNLLSLINGSAHPGW